MNPDSWMLIVTVTITMCTTIIPAQAEDSRFPIELDYRCMDAIREMILDSCGHFQDLMMKERMEEHQKELEQNPSQLEHGRSKRHMDNLAENVNDVNFRVHYLTNETHETFLKGHRFYNVRHSNYPEGAHLILSQHDAKLLRNLDRKFKIEPRQTVYRSVNGKLVKDHAQRHRRHVTDIEGLKKLAACCTHETECMYAFCFIEL